MTGKRGKPWHGGTYQVQARHVRAAANANPDTRCARCGLTLTEGIARYGQAGGRWEAGHKVDSQVNGALQPEHATCNRSAGAAYGNRLREPRSEDPYR